MMQGLLDFIKTPEGQGLLSGVFGYAANARRGTPINNLGRGGIAGLLGYSNAMEREQQAKDNAFQQEYRALQTDQLRQQAEQQKRQQAWRTQLPALMQPKLQGTDAVTNQIAAENAEFGDFGVQKLADLRTPLNISYGPDQNALQAHLMSPDSPFADKMLERQLLPKEAEPFTLGEGQVRYDGRGQVVASGPQKTPELPSAVREYEYAKEQGYPGNFNDWLLAKQRAGATNVTTKVESKASDSVAGQVGPILKESLTSAEGAARVDDAATRVLNAVRSGNIIAGTGANARIAIAQLANTLGVSGATDQETLLNTRRVVRGLAEMTLQGRKEMSGQGAITDRESALAEKATSGDIANLTPAEIVELAAASQRSARYQVEKHRKRVESSRNLPGMENIAPFFEVPAMPQALPDLPPATQHKGRTIRDTQTGKLLRSDGMIWKEVK
jgi:hypothetical protein